MKRTKKLSIIILTIIGIIAIGYLLPKRAWVERTYSINAPIQIVYNQINNPRYWAQWSSLTPTDSLMNLSYFGSGAGVGSGFRWNTTIEADVKREMTITDSSENEYICTEFDFAKNSKAKGHFTFTDNGNTTEVNWRLETELNNNPVDRWLGLSFTWLFSSELDYDLSRLETLSEDIASTEQSNKGLATNQQ